MTDEDLFQSICGEKIPPIVPFTDTEEIIEIKWPDERKKLFEIRNPRDKRLSRFSIKIYGQQYNLIARVPRIDQTTLKILNPDEPYPEFKRGQYKPLNYLFYDHNLPVKLNGKSHTPYVEGAFRYENFINSFTSDPQEIKAFATCVLKILKGKKKFPRIKEEIKKQAIEIAGLIVTSEYLRGKQALSISFTEFYQLKYDPTLKRLNSMYKDQCTLLYPQDGGSQKIMNAEAKDLKESFNKMFKCYTKLETIKAIYSKLSRISKNQLKEKFNAHKMQQLRFIYGIIDKRPKRIKLNATLAEIFENQK